MPTTPARSLSRAESNWLTGWGKDGEEGKFLSLSAMPVEEPKPKRKPAASRASFEKPVEDEIPFAPEFR